MALGWLWVACSPSWFKVRGSTFDVRRSACGRNFKRRKSAFRPSAVSPAYITRPGRGWSGPKLSPGSLPCMPGDSPMTLPCVSPAPIIGLAYATGAPAMCPKRRHSITYKSSGLRTPNPGRAISACKFASSPHPRGRANPGACGSPRGQVLE